MEIRYQVFVSSTFEDLQDERKEVMQALLELDCIPAGMELFPASNEDQWSLIKRVIDDSDYYLLIIGGRYGSCSAEGKSYTEMEFRYALDSGKPIVSFLHKSPEEIKNKFTEQDVDKIEKLSEFRKFAQQKMIKYWLSAEELGSVVSRSMVKLIKQFPTGGWVKSDSARDIVSASEILKLKEEIEQLENLIALQSITAPKGTELLSQGDDSLTFVLLFKGRDDEYNNYECNIPVKYSWNQLFATVSPYLIGEDTEDIMINAIINSTKNNYREELIEYKKKQKLETISNFSLIPGEFQTIKIQFKALGLIQQSKKNRSVKDSHSYWTLTPYGDHVMTQLIAVPKETNMD